MERAYAFGRSQTGRCIRDAIWRGFNADAAGRKVFDGVLAHVAGCGRMWMNHRFANVVVPAGQQYEDHDNAADSFPFSYAECRDHLTGRSDAICKRPETDPLIFHTQTATEYWQRRGSLVHTDTEGNDLEQPENVRVYFWSSAPHVADPNQGAPARGVCQNLSNVVQTSMLFRALLDAMDRWASEGIAPPPSRIPRRGDGSLVGMDEWRAQFPDIPGIATPREAQRAAAARLRAGGGGRHSGHAAARGRRCRGLHRAGAGGRRRRQRRAGVKVPMVAAPLATYTGWNLRSRGHGEGAMHEFTGSTIPLPETESVRAATGDPRLSIERRYGDAEGYVAAMVEAAKRLVADGLMLEEDVGRVERRARYWSRPLHDVRL